MTDTYLPSTTWLHDPATNALLKAFSDADVRCRFVGGCVRDALLGIPVKDIDVATPALPSRVIELLLDAGIKAIPTGLAHGTVTAIAQGRHFEITTLRRDEETYGRHAKVAFTDDWAEDAKRRDFTMNALYADANGKIYDYFNGVEDAKAGHVRFIGSAEERIKEDALRILRFFRFNALFGKDPIDTEGLTACREWAMLLDNLSGERISAEMCKLLTAPRAAEVLTLMQKEGILSHVLPGARHFPALSELRVLEATSRIAPHSMRSLALLLHTGKMQARETIDFVHDRWKISNADFKRLAFLASHALGVIVEAEQKKLLRHWGKELFIDRVLIEWARLPGDSAYYAPMLKLAQEWEAPVFPLTGADLIKTGHAPGPKLGKLLKKLEEQWEESGYALEKAALLKAIGKGQ